MSNFLYQKILLGSVLLISGCNYPPPQLWIHDVFPEQKKQEQSEPEAAPQPSATRPTVAETTTAREPVVNTPPPNPTYVKKDRPPQQSVASQQPLSGTSNQQQPPRTTRFSTPPSAPVSQTFTNLGEINHVESLEGDPVSLNIESMPIPAFINEVFGNSLGLSFEIEPKIDSRKDLVTLRLTEPQTPDALYSIATQVLEEYGITAARRGQIIRFGMSRNAPAGDPPLLISGDTLPNVPLSHRPIFQMVPLKVIRAGDANRWLRQAFSKQKLTILDDGSRNLLILQGSEPIVSQALAAVKLLDQPTMQGRFSLKIEPAFWAVEKLADELEKILATEGYAATTGKGGGSVILIPIKPNNSLLVFATNQQTLTHVREWVNTLDQPGDNFQEEQGVFSYAVQNAAAEEISEVLRELLGGIGGQASSSRPAGTSAANTSGSTPQSTNVQSHALGGTGETLVVDNTRNIILFYGRGETWRQLLNVMRELDQPPRLALIEVTIADVTLSDQNNLGIEWLLNNIDIDNLTGRLSTLGGLGAGSSGLTYILNNAGERRAILNALASDSTVKILSTPRIMVESGKSASINIGNEVPVISSQSTSPDQFQGNTGILQQIQYRSTGIQLQLEPVIHAGNRIDLEVAIQDSSAIANEISGIDSPVILNRQANTSLSLQDGGSILIGGLIRRLESGSVSKVPLLGDIPLLGNLFRSSSIESEQSELMILIVPYIIQDYDDAVSITDAFRRKLHYDPANFWEEKKSWKDLIVR